MTDGVLVCIGSVFRIIVTLKNDTIVNQVLSRWHSMENDGIFF